MSRKLDIDCWPRLCGTGVDSKGIFTFYDRFNVPVPGQVYTDSSMNLLGNKTEVPLQSECMYLPNAAATIEDVPALRYRPVYMGPHYSSPIRLDLCVFS